MPASMSWVISIISGAACALCTTPFGPARGARRVEHRPRRRPAVRHGPRAPRRSIPCGSPSPYQTTGTDRSPATASTCGLATAPSVTRTRAPESSRIHATSSGRRCQLRVTAATPTLAEAAMASTKGMPFGSMTAEPVTLLDAERRSARGPAATGPFVELPVGQGAVARDDAHGGPGARPAFAGKPFTARADPHRWNTNRRAPRHDAGVRFCRSAQGQAAARRGRRARRARRRRPRRLRPHPLDRRSDRARPPVVGPRPRLHADDAVALVARHAVRAGRSRAPDRHRLLR